MRIKGKDFQGKEIGSGQSYLEESASIGPQLPIGTEEQALCFRFCNKNDI